ncbi:putative cyclase [Dichomitus squalens]|uniref:Putative cyclase n=1 Tax=Dichomitus squalens TaxID=114155 RepID=A0A4Q9M7D7_9APHY|nr:putative cyclase [Dichomitus squalens]
MAAVYVDLSHTLEPNAQIYPGDPAFACCPVQTIAEDGNSVHSILMGSHTGTHVDAPNHFCQNGAPIDQLPLSTFIGNTVVVDVTQKSAKAKISWADLAAYEGIIRQKVALDHGAFVLLHTGWSKHWKSQMYYEHPFLEAEAAKRLLELGVKVIGVDALSPDETRVDGSIPDFAVHGLVLGAGAVIAENLTNLEAIQKGDWLVSLVPLKLGGLDGSPVRAFAWSAAALSP